ncbi:MAG: HlyC/CorC family transporter, partial [Rhodospirillaceae bacterium]|nr:HlyC/CorC family transporter [Rhodospirillaceae bacterium]
MIVWPLIATGILLLANGFFVASEIALPAARRRHVEELAADGGIRARAALQAMRDLPLMFASAQFGITVASLGLGFITESTLAQLFQDLISNFGDPPEALAHAIAVPIALLVVALGHMIIGEMAPKNAAIAAPERVLLSVAVPFRAFTYLFWGVLWVLNLAGRWGLRLLGVEMKQELMTSYSAAEIALMMEDLQEQGTIGPTGHDLVRRAFTFGTLRVREVMTPRVQVVFASTDTTPRELERLVIETGHSRYPVYDGDPGNIRGFFHAKDLLGLEQREWDRRLSGRVIRPLLAIPESAGISDLPAELRRSRSQMALVVDEHGSPAGVVTMEDLAEELVGNITDESAPGIVSVRRTWPDRYRLDGTAHLDEIAEIAGCLFPEGDYETVAGFLLDRLGSIPRRGEAVELPPREVVVHEL